MAIGASEAETFWAEFLRSLARRGLRGVQLVISDDHKGLKAAASRILGATWQRCRVHFARNLLAHAGRQGRRVVSAFVRPGGRRGRERPVAPGRRPAQAQGSPKLAALMDEAEHDVLAYMSFPSGSIAPEVAFDQPDRTAPCRGQAPHQCRRRSAGGPSTGRPASPQQSPTTTPSHGSSAPSLLEQNDEWAVSEEPTT